MGRFGTLLVAMALAVTPALASAEPADVAAAVAAAGRTSDDDKPHRIDPAVVSANFERPGFALEGTSDLLRNPADDRSLLVFDPKIRGRTDRFIFRFRKPA